MVKFAASIGAARCQTFADEARSEGFIGVEGDDPSIYWTYKTPAGFGPNENKTAGVYAAAPLRPSFPACPRTSWFTPPPLRPLRSYAIDLETERPINATHAAVLFDDRVTQPNFLAPTSSLPDAPGKGDARDGQGRNCSYFALASIDKVQKRLVAMGASRDPISHTPHSHYRCRRG